MNPYVVSTREYLAWVFERFEFKAVPAWILQEERRLFADSTFETHMRFDVKVNPDVGHMVDRKVPVLPIHDQTEMGYRYILLVDKGRRERVLPRNEMGGDLIAEEIEIEPVFRSTPDTAAQDVDIEGARRRKVVDGEREVKTRPSAKLFERTAFSVGHRF